MSTTKAKPAAKTAAARDAAVAATKHARKRGQPKAESKAIQAAGNDAKKLSALDAAAQVLQETKTPMTCQELIEAMANRKLWNSPSGKTPAATLYSAILRETAAKGDQARFRKTERGK